MIHAVVRFCGGGNRRSHIAIMPSFKGAQWPWILAQAIPTQHGYRFEYPWPTTYRTKRLALIGKQARVAEMARKAGT